MNVFRQRLYRSPHTGRRDIGLQPSVVLPCHQGMEIAVWSLAITLIVVGVVGCVVPLLPGTTLILAAALLQKWLLPDTLTWLAVGWIAVFWLFSVLADLACTIVGTKLFGGTRWGMAGATGGALVGMFISIPALVVGTTFGAIAAEKILGERTTGQALRAGLGAALGFVLSIFARLACAGVMVALYIVSTTSALPRVT